MIRTMSSAWARSSLSLVRRKLGYLFQDAALFDSLTLYENLALPLTRLTKKSKDEIDDVVHRALTDVGLGADGAKYPVRTLGRYEEEGRPRQSVST